MTAEKYLEFLNKEYFNLHKKYEDLFWTSYMGDHSVDKRKDEALKAKDKFKTNPKYTTQIKFLLKQAKPEIKERLNLWLMFFNRYQIPPKAAPIKAKIDKLESAIHKKMATRKEGYIDPSTKKFVEASDLKMSTMMITHSDELVRKACFEAREKSGLSLVNDYLKIIKLRNQFAKILGYEDFYAYKAEIEEGMTKKEIFTIFNAIYRKTKYAYKNIRNIEKKIPGLRKPWNFSYIMAGNFVKEEDQYFRFDEALIRWGRSFAALGIDFKGGELQLDLLDRKGKYHNGFCHWPEMVRFEKGKFLPGKSNFTCNVVAGQVGAGDRGIHTLFHEGGHAAHLLNSKMKDVCVNHEYAPMSTAWAETQSMFLDNVFSSIEWRVRYAKNKKEEKYPFELYKKQVEKLNVLRPIGLNRIIFVANFEKEIYETKNLTKDKVLKIAKSNFRKYLDRSEDSLWALSVPHIYSWESSASYHGYALATLALNQWRKYFYDKYGFIVDNPKVGGEMERVWRLGGSKTFKEFVVLATSKKLSAEAYLANVTATIPEILKKAKAKIVKLSKIKPLSGPVKLDANIKMVHGKKVIADNKKSFEDMALKYKKWLKTQAS